MAIWQDLISDYGFTSSYQGVKRYVHKRRALSCHKPRP